MKWIEPSTDAEITRAGLDKTAILVVPIAFVSEHSETLVELDIEYKELAHRDGVPGYFRVPTQQRRSGFYRVAWRIWCGSFGPRASGFMRPAMWRHAACKPTGDARSKRVICVKPHCNGIRVAR